MESNNFFFPLSKFEDYTAIGFDVDHCLTRYKIRNFSQLLYDSCIEKLKSLHNYPKEVFEDKITQDIINFAMNSLVVDVVKINLFLSKISRTIYLIYRIMEI